MKQLLKKLQTGFLAIALLSGVVALAPTGPVSAIDPGSQIQKGIRTTGGGGGGERQLNNGIQTFVNVLLYIIGILAVIMLIFGGIRYTTSNGNAEQIKAAKNTIMYAIIGLLVAIFAFAIVNFVVGAF